MTLLKTPSVAYLTGFKYETNLTNELAVFRFANTPFVSVHVSKNRALKSDTFVSSGTKNDAK